MIMHNSHLFWYIKNLAPGSYHPEKVNLNKSPHYSFGVKPEVRETDSIPGMVVF